MPGTWANYGQFGGVDVYVEPGGLRPCPVYVDQASLQAALGDPPADRGRRGRQHQPGHHRLIKPAEQPMGPGGQWIGNLW